MTEKGQFIDWKNVENWFRVGEKAVQCSMNPCSDVIPRDPTLILRNPHPVYFDEATKEQIQQEAIRDLGRRFGW